MTQEKKSGIAYKPLPPELQVVEQEKARLLLEAHTFKAQARFTEAAERFAQAAHQVHLCALLRREGHHRVFGHRRQPRLAAAQRAVHRLLARRRDLWHG